MKFYPYFITEMSKLYTDSVHYNYKKSAFFLKFEKNENFDFFQIQAKLRGFFSQSGGLDLNCLVFEYLMMYLFGFKDIITHK